MPWNNTRQVANCNIEATSYSGKLEIPVFINVGRAKLRLGLIDPQIWSQADEIVMFTIILPTVMDLEGTVICHLSPALQIPFPHTFCFVSFYRLRFCWDDFTWEGFYFWSKTAWKGFVSCYNMGLMGMIRIRGLFGLLLCLGLCLAHHKLSIMMNEWLMRPLKALLWVGSHSSWWSETFSACHSILLPLGWLRQYLSNSNHSPSWYPILTFWRLKENPFFAWVIPWAF